jgi:hypothetical protein
MLSTLFPSDVRIGIAGEIFTPEADAPVCRGEKSGRKTFASGQDKGEMGEWMRRKRRGTRRKGKRTILSPSSFTRLSLEFRLTAEN